MSDPRALIRAQAKAKEGGKTTTKDKRIHYVSCTGDDDYLAELADCHGAGKQQKKSGEAQFGKARRLYNHVRELLIADRRPERPKQFVYKGKLKPGKDGNGTSQHVCTINVKENGYSRIDIDKMEAVKELVGNEWAETYITESIVASIDFSMVPKEKEKKVFEVLSKLNQFIGSTPKEDADGKPVLDESGDQVMCEFVEYNVGYKPNSMYHSARALLPSEVDADLEELTPTVCAFGR